MMNTKVNGLKNMNIWHLSVFTLNSCIKRKKKDGER